MSRQVAAETVAQMVESAKTILTQAKKLSDEHGLAFEYQLTDNSQSRAYNGWDDSGCIIGMDDEYWQSSAMCW